MSIKSRRIVACLAVLACLLATPAAAQNLGQSIQVDRLEFPVTLPDGSHATVVGRLYYHGSFRNRPLQVLVHGATYNHTYWDFTAAGDGYSYARYMAAPGRKYAVLAIDMLAAGESSHPADGLHVTLAETAVSLKQVVDAMRSGDNPTGYAFSPIALVGHSAGSIAATLVQSAWHSADALVVTASRHTTSLPLSPGIAAVLPVAGALAALPYFSLPADFRAALFYYAPGADAAVIAADNATADVWTGGQVQSTFAAFLYPLAVPLEIDGVGGVTGPVLIQLGEFDALFPAGRNAEETALWESTTPIVQTISGIGHDFNLHLNREQSWSGIADFLSAVLAKH